MVNSPYAGDYELITNMSLYDSLPNTSAHDLTNVYTAYGDKEYGLPVKLLDASERSLVFYALFRVSPRAMQGVVYNNGNYHDTSEKCLLDAPFMSEWTLLHHLSDLTQVADDAAGENDFLLLANEVTHQDNILQLPDYEPAMHVDEDTGDPSRFVLDGRVMHVDTRVQMAHYHVNATALINLGRWFDWMREQGVYDNTRIIIVSDHGRDLYQFDDERYDEEFSVEEVNPLFMVKDFNAHGFATSDEFMTNADTPTLAMRDIVANPVNPFTGKPINADEKTAHDQLVTTSYSWDVEVHRGNTCDTDKTPWYAVHDNIFDMSNWRRVD